MKTPEQVRQEMEKLRAELIRLLVDYQKERPLLGKNDMENEKALANALVLYVSNFRRENPGKQIPAEDVRKAYSHGLIGDTWQALSESQATVDVIEKQIRVNSTILSSLQSELNHLTEELKNS